MIKNVVKQDNEGTVSYSIVCNKLRRWQEGSSGLPYIPKWWLINDAIEISPIMALGAGRAMWHHHIQYIVCLSCSVGKFISSSISLRDLIQQSAFLIMRFSIYIWSVLTCFWPINRHKVAITVKLRLTPMLVIDQQRWSGWSEMQPFLTLKMSTAHAQVIQTSETFHSSCFH